MHTETGSCRCYRCLRYLVLPARYGASGFSGTFSTTPVGEMAGWLICEDCGAAPDTGELLRLPLELPLCPICRRIMDAERRPIRQMTEQDRRAAAAVSLCVDCEPIPAN
jgi:hypothetical protein